MKKKSDHKIANPPPQKNNTRSQNYEKAEKKYKLWQFKDKH